MCSLPVILLNHSSIPYHLFLYLLLSGGPLSSSSKVVLNASLNHEVVKVEDPISFSEMLVTKIKELLKGMYLTLVFA
jgi:hypothetical protein